MEPATLLLVDLSVPVGEEYPCSWPGLTPFAARQTLGADIPDEYFISRSLTMEEHLGTHVDALSHATADDNGTRLTSLDTLPLARFCGRPRVIDSRAIRGHINGESPWILPALVTAHEARTEPLKSGDVALFWTGWSDEFYHGTPQREHYVDWPLSGRSPGWPALHADTLHYLAERHILTVGVDTPSLGATHDPLSPHRAAFSTDITPVENLTNLADVTDGMGLFIFLPLAMLRATGAPGRAVVVLLHPPEPQPSATSVAEVDV
jgi:arylformamidase